MDMRIVLAAAVAVALSFASNVAAQDSGPSALNTTEAELAKYAAARAACESLLADERAAIDTYDEANATGLDEQRKVDALETELTVKQLDPNPSNVTKQRIKDLPKLSEGARTRLAEAAARRRAAAGAEDRTYAKYLACLAQYIGAPTSVGSTDATAPATPVASPADTPLPAQLAPTDPNSPSGITPTDLTPSPSPAPGPPAPTAAPSVPITLPASAPRQPGELPAVWCVIQRVFTVIPGQNVNQASVARCDDVPGLGADWHPVQSNLTFPAANAIRDGINGANMPTVWCVMQRQGQNGPERTVIRCDNTTGAGPDWMLVDSNLTWPAATQEAFGTPSGGGQPFVPGVSGPPASSTPQAMGPVVGGQSGPSAAGPVELIDDLPRSTPRVGDSAECQQAQRSYEFARAEYPRVVLAITGQQQSFERIMKVIEAADGGIPLELNEEGKANPDYGQWRSSAFMAVELREQLKNAEDQMLSEQINVDRLCGFQIGNKWFPPKWRPGIPSSDNPPPLLPPSKTPPPKIAVDTPPRNTPPESPPTNVTPVNPHSCTKYTCTYMEVTPPTSNYTVWDVCVPSGDWSRASCTFQWWDMAKLANNNTPDPNHPDGHDARDACQLPTVFGVTDHASFVKYCNAKFRGHLTEPEQSAQHADVASATPPDVAVDSPIKPATQPPPDVAIDSPRLATPAPPPMPSHQPSVPNTEPSPEPAPPPTVNSGAPSQPQINVYIPPAPPPEPGPPMVHDPHTPPVTSSPQPAPPPSHQPAPPPIIDTFTPPKPAPPPPTVYGQACSDPVNGVITCTDTEKRKCTTTSGTCDPRTGQVFPAPPKPPEPKTALPATPLPPKTVEPTPPKPLPPKTVEPTQPKPLPPKTVEPTQPKPLPAKTVEPTQPKPLPAKTVEPTQPKPQPSKTAEAQPAVPPAPPPPPLPQQVAKVEPPPEPPDCIKAGGHFHVDRSEPLTIQQTSVGGASCRNKLTAGGTTHFTGVSISSQPSHGDVKQAGDYAFEYRPHRGFKGSDSYAVEVCGTSNAGSGCSIITYETTVE